MAMPTPEPGAMARKRAAMAARRERARTLRAEGLGYAVIGLRLGISEQRAWADVNGEPPRAKTAKSKIAGSGPGGPGPLAGLLPPAE